MIYQSTTRFLFKETEQFQSMLFHIIPIHFGNFSFLSCMSCIKKKLVFIFLHHCFRGLQGEV